MKNYLNKWLRCAVVASAVPALAQTPTARPEPTAFNYDLSELNLLPQYNRATFKAAFGTEAPAFDISRFPKTWFDSTQICTPGGNSNYQVMAGFNAIALTISSCEAATVNLLPDVQPQFPPVLEVHDSGVRYTGVVDLDVYLQNAVNRMETAATIGTTPIDAAKMIVELQPDAQFLCTWQSFNDAHFRGGVDPNCANPSPLLARYSDLIKTWAHAAAEVQDLMGSVPGTPCKFCDAIAKAPVAMPVRPLYPDERISLASMMGGQIIMRTVPPKPVEVQGGTFTDADRQALQQVLQILKRLTGQ